MKPGFESMMLKIWICRLIIIPNLDLDWVVWIFRLDLKIIPNLDLSLENDSKFGFFVRK